VSVVPTPAGRCARTTFSGGSYLVVTRGALDPERAWAALEQLMDDTRPAVAAHHIANRRLIRRACREAGLELTPRRFVADRLHPMPHIPGWAAVENRLAEALSDWLVRARRGVPLDLAAEAATLTADLAGQASL
jgi:hypothetical protein